MAPDYVSGSARVQYVAFHLRHLKARFAISLQGHSARASHDERHLKQACN